MQRCFFALVMVIGLGLGLSGGGALANGINRETLRSVVSVLPVWPGQPQGSAAQPFAALHSGARNAQRVHATHGCSCTRAEHCRIKIRC